MSDAENLDKTHRQQAEEPDLTVSGAPGASSVSPNSIEGLFLLALQKDVPGERNAWLQDMCGDDPERLRRVTALLLAYEDAGSFLETPAAGPRPTDEISLSFLKPSTKDGCLGSIGPYEVLEVIGRGGMGLVLRAVDLKLNRIVAVKVLLPELAANPNARRRFLREAQAAAAVSHPHVVTIHAVEEAHNGDDGTATPPFLVMECVVGQSLQQKLDNVGSLRLAEILRISRQVGEGLAAAHQQGLIHRDIKPANILLENGVERVKITDFGLARAIDDITVTRTGEVSGTPQYMSPEQAGGERVDHRSDLFSLGCVMYAMCTGHSPFRGDSLAHVIKRVTQDTPRPIADQNAEVPPWLIQIIDCLLQKNADDRFQSAEELVVILDQHLARIQQPTDSGNHSLINQQVPKGAAAAGPRPGVASAAVRPAGGNAPQPANRLGGSGRVVVPKWMRVTSRIWFGLITSIFVLVLILSTFARSTFGIGTAEVLIIATIFGLGQLIMTLILLRATVSREVMAIALFVGLGPFGLLLYVLIKDKLQPASNDSTAAQPGHQRPGSPEVAMPQWLATPVVPWRMSLSNWLLLIGIPALCSGLLGLAALANDWQFHIASFRPIDPEGLTFGSLGLAVLTLLPAAMLRVSERKTPPSAGSLIAWFLVGGPIGIIIWLIEREHFNRRTDLLRSDDQPSGSSGRPEIPTPKPAATECMPAAQFDETGAAETSFPADSASEHLSGAVTRRQPTKRQFLTGIVLLPAMGAAGSMFLLSNQLLETAAANAQKELFRFPAILFGLWVLQMLGNLIVHRNRGPARQSVLFSSATFSAIAVGWFWTTVLRMPVTDNANTVAKHTLIEFGLPASMIWLLYCVYVYRQLPKTLDVPAAKGSRADSATSMNRSAEAWRFGRIAVLTILCVWLFIEWRKELRQNFPFGGSSTLSIHHHGQYKPTEIFIEGRQVAPSTHKETYTSVQGLQPGVFDVAVGMIGPSNRKHTLRQQVWVRAEKGAEMNLWLPVEFDAADELGPADREYGGLILDIADAGLHVLLLGKGPGIVGYYPMEIPAGRHKIPVGRYSVMVFDKHAGWLNDIVSGPGSTYEGVLRTMDTTFGVLNHLLKLYDRQSGAYTASQYGAENGQIEIKPGAFQTVVATRQLKKLAGRANDKQNRDGKKPFDDDKFYRFLWNGKAYSFSKIQAQVVNDLLQRKVAGEDTVDAESLLKAIGNQNDLPAASLSAIFNNGKHPAWNEVVQVNSEDPATVALTPLTKPPSESLDSR